MIEAIFGRRCSSCHSLMGGFLSVITGRWTSIAKPHMCVVCFWAEVACATNKVETA